MEAAPIEWLPGEMVARVFCFVDAKTLMTAIPLVSGRSGWALRQALGEVLGLPSLTRGSGACDGGGKWRDGVASAPFPLPC